MKKLYAFIAAALLSTFGAMAQDWETFTEKLVVSINDIATEPADKDFYLSKQADGKYTFKITNLSLVDENGEPMNVGSLTLEDVDVTVEANGDETLSCNSHVAIEAGDDPTVDFWIGPLVTLSCAELGGVPVVLNGTKRANRLYVTIDIDITSVMGQFVYVTLGEPLPEVVENPLEWETFTEKLVVSINNIATEPADKDFYLSKQADGKYTFKITNLSLVDENGEPMNVGSLTLEDVDVTVEANGDETLSCNSHVAIEAGDDPTVDFWIGPLVTLSCAELGGVPVVLNGTKRANRLYVTIDIDITSVMGQFVYVTLGEPLPEVPADAIGSVQGTTKVGAAYDLQGRRVQHATRGLRIIDGKKIVK